MTDLYRLLLGVLCVWRITHLFQAEDGPWDVVARIRRAAGDGFWGRLLDCFYCLSLWVAAPVAWLAGRTLTERVVMGLAFSGGAILAERITTGSSQAEYVEDQEEEHGMLRTTAGAGGGRNSGGSEAAEQTGVRRDALRIYRRYRDDGDGPRERSAVSL